VRQIRDALLIALAALAIICLFVLLSKAGQKSTTTNLSDSVSWPHVPSEIPKKFLLVYDKDGGCNDIGIWTELGCSHYVVRVVKEFASPKEAVEWLNSQGELYGIWGTDMFWREIPNLHPVLYRVEQIPLKQVVVGHHKDTQPVPKEVEVEDKAWAIQ
jgi:hypothetical protein